MAPAQTNEAPAGASPARVQPQDSAASADSQPAAKTEKTQPQKPAPNDADSAQTNGEKKLSGAELKKQQKAEKQARREREKAEKAAATGAAPIANGIPAGGSNGPKPAGEPGNMPKPGAQQQRGGQEARLQHRRAPSQGASTLTRPQQLRPSQPSTKKEPKKMNKEVGLFGHLYSQPRRYNMEGVSKEVHPAVLALGFQMSNYVICGSNARCVAMLLAFKKVRPIHRRMIGQDLLTRSLKAIQAYTTPVGNSLARHLTSHYLSPQIDYLKSHRPISVSMGNAIRWLKDYIIHIDPDTLESTAKTDICEAIDTFIRERITVADTAIASTASSKIRNGSTIVTYAKSSIVEQTLLRAHESGTRFKVIVIDSRPLHEGKNLARSLAHAGIEVQYMLLEGQAFAVKDADLVLLGAHAMMANGRLYSRVGTAAVAMSAHFRDVPVIVCCESIKFTDRVALDSIVLNEIAPPGELLLPPSPEQVVTAPAPEPEKPTKGGKAVAVEPEKRKILGLEGWRDVQNLQLLNILFDVTPAEYIDMVITEYGSLPPSSVPVVHRISTERDVRT